MSSLPETPESYSVQLHSHQPTVQIAQSSPLRQTNFHDISHSPTAHSKPQLPTPASHNRVTSFMLKAEGMSPFQVNLEALLPSPPNSAPPPVMIHTKLAVAPTTDARCSPAFQGFNGSVVVEKVWSDYACCYTRVFVGKTCVSEESEALDVSRIDERGRVIASLPRSRLSECRWLDPTQQPTTLVQDVLIDNIAVFRVIYQLDRAHHCPYPSVELLRFAHATRPQQLATSPTLQYQVPSPSMHGYYGHGPTSPISPTDTTSPAYPWGTNASSIANFGISPIATTTSPISF